VSELRKLCKIGTFKKLMFK